MEKKCGGCMGHKIAWLLAIIGGINWGLVGLGDLIGSAANWNVVEKLLDKWPTLLAIVYLLVGISALLLIFGCRCKKCMACKAEGMSEM
ncbi:MAG: DUF378 domain-containing protein [bacterium]|nr:DUF378 domain-containing protein [bacterium]